MDETSYTPDADTGGTATTTLTAPAPVRGARMLHLDDFEPAIALTTEEEAAYRRRFGVLFADERTARVGGTSQVLRVTNAQGEAFALKVLTAQVAHGKSAPTDAAARQAFAEEYRCHRALSNLKGFPRLYGRGSVDGAPALVMEWIEGETLTAAARRLAVDDAGRISPPVAALIGRELFDAIARMQLAVPAIVHRDISPANVIIRTDLLSVEEQAAEGRFDLAIIDFGSAVAVAGAAGGPRRRRSDGAVGAGSGSGSGSGSDSGTGAETLTRYATPAYAPPEMLTDNPGTGRDGSGAGADDTGASRTTRSGYAGRADRLDPAIDVYEAASVLYELIDGTAPFAEPRTAQAGSTDGVRTPITEKSQVPHPTTTTDVGRSAAVAARAALRHRKLHDKPAAPVSAHANRATLPGVLAREPQVAMAAGREAMELGLDPDAPELADALALVDSQLAELILPCLAADPVRRPSAAAMRDGLAAFCAHYADNIARALRGEPLTPCSESAFGISSLSPRAVKRTLRTIGTAVSAGVGLVVLSSASLLLAGGSARLDLGAMQRQGALPGPLVAVALAIPTALALAVERSATGGRDRFLRGSAALLIGCGLIALLASRLTLDPATRIRGLYAAIFAIAAATWCPLVLAFALAPTPPYGAGRTRPHTLPGSPDGSPATPALAVASATLTPAAPTPPTPPAPAGADKTNPLDTRPQKEPHHARKS